MAVTVKIPTQLRAATGGEAELEVDGLDRRRGARRRLRGPRRPARADHPGRRPAPLRQRLRLRRGHPLPAGPGDRDQRRRRGNDPARRRRRLTAEAPRSVDPLRRARDAAARADRVGAEGAGRDRRPADPLARDRDLRRAGLRALPARHRLPGRDGRGVRRRPSAGRTGSRSSASTPALDTPTGGRIARLAERLGGETLLRHLRRRRRRRRSRRAARLPPRPRRPGDDDRGAAAPAVGRRRARRATAGSTGFVEKPRSEHWINGGFFCFEPGALDYLDEDSVLEREPLARPGRRRPAARLPPRGLLGLHGHLQGRGRAQRPLGGGRGAVDGSGRDGRGAA